MTIYQITFNNYIYINLKFFKSLNTHSIKLINLIRWIRYRKFQNLKNIRIVVRKCEYLIEIEMNAIWKKSVFNLHDNQNLNIRLCK